MNTEISAVLVEIALEELGREKTVRLLERLKKEVKDKAVLQEIGNLHTLAKFAFPSKGGI